MTEERETRRQTPALEGLRHLPVLTYVEEVDRDGDVSLVFATGAFEAITGFDVGDFDGAGLLWDQRLHPDDLPGYFARYERLWRELMPLEATYRFRRRDGVWVWLEDRATAVYDAARGITVVSGAAFDVTARRAADDAAERARRELQQTARTLRHDLTETAGELRAQHVELAESEANYRSLFESVDDLVVVCDVEGRILRVNRAAVRLLGYEPEELCGRRLLDLHPEELREEAAQFFFEMLEGMRSSCPLPLLRADGSSLPTETRVWHGTWDGEACLFGLSRDLLAEREAAERFDRVFRANPALMALTAGDGNGFIDVNDSWLQALGYERDEVIGRTPDELGLFVRPQDRTELAERLTADGRFRDKPVQVRAKDGTILDGVFSAELLRSHGKKYFLTVMVDDTRRRRAETALLELNLSLEQRIEERTLQLDRANRELSGFVHSVAHDLRGPLRTIGSFGQILEHEHSRRLDAEGRDAVRRIVRANLRMERLIDALLDLSGLTHRPLRVSDVDLTQIAREVSDDLRAAQPDRAVEVTVHEGMRARADATLARVVYENLLGNAWKFSARSDLAHVEAGCARKDGTDVFFVRDNGAGFDQRYADRLFAPFERLHDDSDFAGTGIGLATVRRIVEQHGGRVWATGTVDGGATFSFSLAAVPSS